MKKLLTLACSFAALSFAPLSQAGPDPVADSDAMMETAPVQRESRGYSAPFTGLDSISYDYIEAGWALSSFDLDDLDDSHGTYLGMSVSIADSAYIKLFGTIHDETSTAGAAIGLHHEGLMPNVDVITDVGGFYEDISEEFGAYTEFGFRWLTCKWFEMDASAGLEYIDSDAEYYGIFRAIIPLYKGLALVASTKLEDHTQTYRAGLRLNF